MPNQRPVLLGLELLNDNNPAPSGLELLALPDDENLDPWTRDLRARMKQAFITACLDELGRYFPTPAALPEPGLEDQPRDGA